jgi:hypothetical protein
MMEDIMSTLINKQEHNGYTIEVHYDDLPTNPRDYDTPLTRVFTVHNRYNFPGAEELPGDKDWYDFNNWDDVRDYLCKELNVVCIKQIYMMDHSGLYFSFTPFGGYHGHFDSGTIGFILVTKERAREVLGFKRITRMRAEQCAEIMASEFKDWTDYLSGKCYGYHLYKNDTLVDLCWGFVGDWEDTALIAAIDRIDEGLVDNG